MATDSPFTLRVYDKRLQLQGVIGSPTAVSGSVVKNKPGAFQVSISQNDPMVDDVLAKGARIGIGYRAPGEDVETPLISGVRRALSGPITSQGDLQFTIQGDRRQLDTIQALVAPRNPITPTSLDGSTAQGQAQAPLPPGVAAGMVGTIQGQAEYMLWPDASVTDATGRSVIASAEGAVKWLLSINLIDRLGLTVRIAPNLGRGGQPKLPSLRNPPLSEAVQPILDASGLVLSAIQNPGDEFVTIDVREPVLWPAPLTSASGIVDGGTWTLTPPTATRVLVGGPGQGAARAFFEVRDTTGLEDLYGEVVEVFRDATGANLKWPDSLSEQYRVAKYYLLRPEVSADDKTAFQAYIAAAAADALGEGEPTTSVSAELSETDQFHFGGSSGIQLGDRVTITTASGVELQDEVTEGKFSYTASNGLTVSPVLGKRQDDTSRRLADAIVRLAQGQRSIQRDR